MMSRLAEAAQALAQSFGAPGLLIVAFLDSSFLSVPEINDVLLVWMITRDSTEMLWYVAAATTGSLGGCLALYGLGRRGSDAFVRRRFSAAAIDRGRAAFRRYGALAVLVPSMLPPPMPFKLCVLLAGVSGLSVTRFALAVTIGRGIRYCGVAYLALRYGAQATDWLRVHAPSVAMVVLATAGAGLLAYLRWSSTRAEGA
jgi:membrane protein YqaA with SNARE-associated domain